MVDKAAVFIDGGYFAKVREELGLRDVNFCKFSDILCDINGKYRLFTFYYDAPPFQSAIPTDDEKARKARFDMFEYSLRRNPRFIPRLGKLGRFDDVCSQCGNKVTRYKQKRVDNLLTVDLIRAIYKDNIQEAILVTGDSDFVPAVEEAGRAQIIAHVYYLDKGSCTIHDELYMACSERTEITKELLAKALP